MINHWLNTFKITVILSLYAYAVGVTGIVYFWRIDKCDNICIFNILVYTIVVFSGLFCLLNELLLNRDNEIQDQSMEQSMDPSIP